MDISKLAKGDFGQFPSDSVEDRGTMDYYNADGSFSQSFKAMSDAQVAAQQKYRDSALMADMAETGMSSGDAAELYRKKNVDRRAIVAHTANPNFEGQLPLASIDPPADDNKISLEFADPRADLPVNRLQQRAAKAGLALGEDPKALTTEMSDPQGEGQVRQRAVYKDQADFAKAKADYLDRLLKTRDPNQPMDISEAMFIQNLSQSQFTPENPQAIEKLYSQAITDRLMGTTPVAESTPPEQYHNIQDPVEQNIQKHEIAQKLYEDTTADYSANTGIIGHIWNVGEQWIPFKSDLDKYDFSKTWGLPGDNMADQVRNLWLLPPQEFAAQLKAGYDLIAAHNPLDAQDWLASVLSYSRMSAQTANAMFGVDVATTLPFGWIFKGGKVVKGSVDLGETAAKAARQSARDVRPAGSGLNESVLTGEKTFIKGSEESQAYDAAQWTKGVSDHFKGSKSTEVVDDTIDPKQAMQWADDGGPEYDPGRFAAKAALDTQKALAKQEINLEDLFAETGHQEQAIDTGVARRIAEDISQKLPDVREPGEYINLSRKLESLYNPRAWLESGSRLSREAVDRVMNVVLKARVAMDQAAMHGAQAVRLVPEALQKAAEVAKPRLRNEFRLANDGVIDSRWEIIPQGANPDSQINQLVMTIGTPDAMGFRDITHAYQTAKHLYMLRDGDYTLKQVGSEFYIQVKRPLDESDPAVAKAMISTHNETPKSIWNTFLGYWRNPDDLLSPFSRENRKAVTSIGQAMQHYFASAAKEIGDLSPKMKDRMNRVMEVNRGDDGVLSPDGRRGRWFTSVGEYEQNYYNLFKEWPTEKETQAYMLTREISDFDWSVKSLTILRDKSRLGITNVHVKVPESVSAPASGEADELDRLADDGGSAGDIQFSKRQMVDKTFEGKLLDGLPEFDPKHDGSIYILKEGESQGELKYLSDIDRKEMQRLIDEEGYKVYQNADPFFTLDGSKKDMNFILLKNAQTSALRAEDMLPYRAGYHVEYAPGFYTKQGKFFRDGKGRLSYGGDTSVIYHASEAAARKYTKAFEEARLLLKAGKTDELKAHLIQTLPHSYEQFVKLFSDGTLDIDTPMLYTKSGQSTRDSSRAGQGSADLYEQARDAYNSPYNLTSSVNRQFAQEKDLALPSVVSGSEGNPVHNFQRAKMIDPLVSLSRSMHNMVRQRVYDNYQYQSIMSFVEEYANPASLGGSVTKRSLDQARSNPLALITDPLWNEKAPRDKLASAKNAHRAIVNLLGVQSELNRNVDWVLNKVVDSIFEKYGDGAASKAADFLHTKIRDPARYARSIAFHTKLGLFNPIQLFLQAQSVVHAAAITGDLKRSYSAMGAGMLQRYLSLTADENIIKNFANKARAFGWKPDEFLESFENMKLAGIWHVEGEVADLNDIFSNNLFRSKGKQFLDKGVMFFQEGERIVRLNAWNTAYLEFKKANPGKVIGDIERNQILRRYDDLAINMTRSSTGAWQKGILSIPAQFSTYQIHLAEQMLGKRLTLAEKTRAVATYSALYGIPTGAATITAVWPWGQDIKQAAMERGIDTNNGVMDILLNGIAGTALEAITGREYAVAERYGPNGMTFFKEALNPDSKLSLLGLLLGPAGQIGTDILTAMDPVARDLTGIFREGDPKWSLAAEDLANGFRNISTVNNMYQMYYAMNAGKFMSKNGLFTAKADAFDAVVKGIFGFDQRAVNDAYIKIESMREFKDAQEYAKKEFLKVYQKALDNIGTDPKAVEMYMKDAHVWLVYGGFRPDQYPDLIRQSLGKDLSLVEKIERQYTKFGPPGNIDQVDQDMQMQKLIREKQ